MLINLFHRRFLQLGVLFMLTTTATLVQAQTEWSNLNVYVWDFSVDFSAGGGRFPVLGYLTDDFEEALIQSKCFKSVLPRRNYQQYLSHCQNEAGISGNSCLTKITADVVINGKLDDNIGESSVRVNITAIKLNVADILSSQSVSLERGELANPNRRRAKMQELVGKLCSGKASLIVPPNRSPNLPSPEQAVIEYFNAINRHHYTKDAWPMLSPNRKKKATSLECFKRKWKAVETVEVENIELISENGSNAVVSAKISYWRNSKPHEKWNSKKCGDSPYKGKAIIGIIHHIFLVSGANGWLIDKIKEVK